MLEDDQRFEELESKLAALSSQVESLELDTELDPFSEDDVRRTIEYFKSLELAGLESEDFGGEEDFDDEESSSSDDFISVQTTGGPSFKTHWIAPESCENMTRDLARDAFVQGAADRYGTSQQVNNGDVLILLCREAAGEEPEEGSEAEEPEPPKKICRYIGLAYNTLVHPASAEPTSETDESISAPVGNYEIFVWSSCECSGEPAETVVLPSIFEASSQSSDNGNYASIGDAASPDMSNADGLLTEASIRKDNASSAEDIATGISSTITVTDNAAGYKAGLVKLSKDLTEYYLDRKSKTLNFEADKKDLNTHGFESDLFVSKNLTLSNGECGNLETVSISGETFDLALLKEGDGTHDSTFLTTAKISLGSAVSLDDSVAIETFDVIATEHALEDGSTVFLPVIAEEMADEIANSDTLDTSTLALNNPVVTGDGEKFTVSIGTQITTLTANYSSGLLTHKDDPVTAAGPTITFSIPDREVSLANLTSLGNAGPAGHYLKELSTIRATGEYDESGSLDLQVEFDALRSQLNFTERGLFLNETSLESVTLSVGNISISPYTIDTFPDLGEERSDALISNISGLSSSIDSSHSNSEETKIDLTGSLQNTNYTFNKGLLTGVSISNNNSVSLGSIIVPKATAQDPYTPDGTNDDYTPELFKTSVNSDTESEFYQKSVSIFSSSDALINFTNGLAVSLSNPSYTHITGLSLDASNNNGTAEATKLTDISVRGVYDVIYESEQTGDARYYIDYTYQDITLTIQNGLVTETVLGSSTTASKGPINVPGADLKYGCHPEYGCQPDPAGEFFDSSCGSGCPPTSELMLRYRPKNIWRYSEESRSSGTCYEELAHHELDPTQSNKTTQGYTNGGEFRAELVGDEQVDNFYANGVLIPFDDLYFAELPADQLCYDLTFRPEYVQVYFKAHDPSQPNNFCLRLVSEHLKEAGDTTDQTQAYTNGGEMREVVSVGAGGFVTTKPIFYVDNIPRDPDAAGSSWVLGFEGDVPNDPDICTEASEINYTATGGQNTFSETISYAETESPTEVSVSLQYNDINNAAGSSFRFVDSSGTQLDPLESYLYTEGNDPLLFTLEIPQGSTGLDIYMNDQGLAGSSTWELNLTAQ